MALTDPDSPTKVIVSFTAAPAAPTMEAREILVEEADSAGTGLTVAVYGIFTDVAGEEAATMLPDRFPTAVAALTRA